MQCLSFVRYKAPESFVAFLIVFEAVSPLVLELIFVVYSLKIAKYSVANV